MTEQLWTYIVRCGTCGAECNRAEHVPEGKRFKVELSAPMMAFCKVEERHNTLSDLNYNYNAEWVAEPIAENGSVEGSSEQ